MPALDDFLEPKPIKNCFVCGRIGAKRYMYSTELICHNCDVAWVPMMLPAKDWLPWRSFNTISGTTEMVWFDDHSNGLLPVA